MSVSQKPSGAQDQRFAGCLLGLPWYAVCTAVKEPKILVSLCIYLSILVGLNWGDATPAPGGISGNRWRHFGCYNGWGESYWNLLGRNQGCCSTFRNTEDSSHYQKDPVPNVNSAKLQKPISLCTWGIHLFFLQPLFMCYTSWTFFSPCSYAVYKTPSFYVGTQSCCLSRIQRLFTL